MSNNAGGYYFMSLYTRKLIHSYKWDELPINEYVMERVEYLAKDKDQPVIHDGYLFFEWAPGEMVIHPFDEEYKVEHPIVDVLDENNTDDDASQNSVEDDNNDSVPGEDNGLALLEDNNIVSEEEEYIEDNEEEEGNTSYDETNEDVEPYNDGSDEEEIAHIDEKPVIFDNGTTDVEYYNEENT